MTRYRGGEPPYGYTIDAAGELLPCPLEGFARQWALTWRAAGFSLREIGRLLIENGRHPRNGAASWDATQIRRMIKQ